MPAPDNLAQELLVSVGSTHPPVVMREVAKLWDSLMVCFDSLDSDGYLIDLGQLGYQIFINNSVTQERQRFTFAHELGHLSLIENGFPISSSSAELQNLQIERWCNRFASNLLMPQKWIISEVQEFRFENLHSKLHHLAQKFQVSKEAMLIRVSELTSLNSFRIKTQNGSVKILSNHLSKYKPIPLHRYKTLIENHLLNESNNVLELDQNIFAVTTPLKRSKTSEEWMVYFVTSSDGELVDTIEPVH